MNKCGSQDTANDWATRNHFLKSIGMHESQDSSDNDLNRICQRNEVLKAVGLHIEED